jgi:hypothetical protein
MTTTPNTPPKFPPPTYPRVPSMRDLRALEAASEALPEPRAALEAELHARGFTEDQRHAFWRAMEAVAPHGLTVCHRIP